MTMPTTNPDILQRHPDNPILTPADFPGAYAVFNPGQTLCDGQVLLLVPVGHNAGQYRDVRTPFTGHVARSDDGVHFTIDPEPLFSPSADPPYDIVREQCIDFRITRMEDAWYIIHPGCGPCRFATNSKRSMSSVFP